MRTVCIGWGQHDLGVARQLDLTRLERSVRQHHASDFCRIVRCDCDFGNGVNVAVAANERDAVAREQHTVPLRLRPRWLVRRRPDVAGAQVLHVAPLPVVVACRVVMPPGNGKISVAAEPAARIRDQSRVRHVSENADDRLRSVRRFDLAHGGLLRLARYPRRVISLDVLHREATGDPLLQHQLRRAHEWIEMEAARPYLLVKRVVERDDAHPDVVRHEGAHDRLAGAGRRPGVVESIAESIGTERPLILESRQIFERLTRLHQHRQHRRVRRDDELLAQSALEREIRNAKAAVLVRVRSVTHRVRGFRHTPRHAPFRAVRDLAPDASLVRLIEQRKGKGLHHQSRHQVLEHAAAPGQ